MKWSAVLLLLCVSCGSSVFAYDPTGAGEDPFCREDADCVAGVCDAASGHCVQCLSDASCEATESCEAGHCVPVSGTCAADVDCESVAGLPRCVDSACVECVSTADCGGAACQAGRCQADTCAGQGAAVVERVEVGDLETTRSEILASEYAACVEASCCPATPAAADCVQTGGLDRPVNCVSFQDAVRFCSWVGGRVPSGQEWAVLAGPATYPWGDEPQASCERAVMSGDQGSACGSQGPDLACSRPEGHRGVSESVSLCDLAGNLWEWTTTTAGGELRVLRGGGFDTERQQLFQIGFRGYARDSSQHLVDAGIRCVW